MGCFSLRLSFNPRAHAGRDVAADARLATYKANSDIIKGVRQLSTMDGHTTPTCVAYSGAECDLDGNPINGTTLPFNGGPPRHWGCRSVLTSITKTFKELGIKGLPELPDTGERASDLGPIDRKTTMDQFLSFNPRAHAGRDIVSIVF